MNRCINIDWLEVFCNENGEEKDCQYFRDNKYEVKPRSYGTPQYAEMFTIFLYGNPYIEIRRSPYSLKSFGGIFLEGDCHIRLSNRTCYFENSINELRKFLIANNYKYKSLSRIDICLDFNFFDRGDNPAKVMLQYMNNTISKINQCRVSAHGRDSFKERIWNSVSWGSKTSMVTTKLYCKSLELKEVHDKFYIRDQWKAAGLREDIPVWRVEFSIKSDMKHILRLDTGELIKHDLTCYDDRHKCLFRFHSLAHHYFHFKYVERKEDGTLKRKDRCKDKILFRISKDEQAYKAVRLNQDEEPTRTDELLIKKLSSIVTDYNQSYETREAAKQLIVYFVEHKRMIKYDKFAQMLILS